MNGGPDNDELDDAYNLTFRILHELLVHGKSNQQYSIWLREGRGPGISYGYYYVPVGKSVDSKYGKPIALVANWVPNTNDAGRTLRRIVDATVEYIVNKREEVESAGNPPTPDSGPDPRPDPQTPGVG